MTALLIPGPGQLAGWGGVLFASLVLMGVGRLVSAGRAAPEAALVAGWGLAALLLTVWGAALPVSLRWPAGALILAAAAGLALPGCRLAAGEWLGLGRIAALGLPLLLVMASARPSEPDTFLNLLPNALYLYRHAGFPFDGGPDPHSYLPAAPYNLQLYAFLAGLPLPAFPANALIAINLVLQLAAGLLLARLAWQGENTRSAPPWGMAALGLLLATALNPGFVPRYHLSGYSEPGVTVTLAFAGWFAVEALGLMGSGRAAGRPLWLLALSLAALVEMKQDSVALVAALLVAAAVRALLSGGHGRVRRIGLLAAAAVPALVLFLVWRWYVLGHFAVGELKPLPYARWQLASVPLILWHMLEIAGRKIVFFGALAATLLLILLRRDMPAAPRRAAALLCGTFILYSLALVAAYATLFPGEMGSDAHSYFRYATHLSLLLMATIALAARGRLVPWAAARFGTVLPAALIVLMLASPAVFLRFLRFDLEPPELRAWTIARAAAAELATHDHVVLFLPGDNGSLRAMLETVLRMLARPTPELVLHSEDRFSPHALAEAGEEGYRLALVSCVPESPAPGSAALLDYGVTGWHVIAELPYAPVPPGARWSEVLTPKALCL